MLKKNGQVSFIRNNRPPSGIVTNGLLHLLSKQADKREQGVTVLEACLQAQVDRALTGDTKAMKFISDMTQGRPSQQITMEQCALAVASMSSEEYESLKGIGIIEQEDTRFLADNTENIS